MPIKEKLNCDWTDARAGSMVAGPNRGEERGRRGGREEAKNDQRTRHEIFERLYIYEARTWGAGPRHETADTAKRYLLLLWIIKYI